MRISNSNVDMTAWSNSRQSHAQSVNVKVAVGGEEFLVQGEDIHPLDPEGSILDAVPAYLVDNMHNPGRQWVQEQTAAAQEGGEGEKHANLSHGACGKSGRSAGKRRP